MQRLKKALVLLLCIVLLATGVGTGVTNFNVYAADPTHTGTVDVNDVLNVRSGAGTGYKILGQLLPGATVNIYEKTGDWYKIAYKNDYGYVSAAYIKNVKEIPKYDLDADFETNLTKQKFPESYKVLLRQLHAQHPNWVFVADHLSMTWDQAVKAESEVGHSLVQNVSSTLKSWMSMGRYAYNWDKAQYVAYDSGNWVTAEKDVVEYFMEPRNFLNENYIYMFLDQTYNPSLQNAEGLQKILNGTFMEGEFPEDTHETYNDVIMEAAQSSGVSPYVLAASIIIEQGVNGTGGSIKGTIEGFEGIYNFFNIRAYSSGGYDAVTYGLMYAAGEGSLGRPWNTRAKSIIGGAQHYANGYVKRGQDNLYYKRFNVIAPPLYANEYMTNVQGAYLETSKLKEAYSNVKSDASLTFSIPVYKSLPTENTTKLPTSKGANNYYITDLIVDGTPLKDFDMYQNDGYELIAADDASKIKIEAKVPSGATVSGTGEQTLKQGSNTFKLKVTAASGKTNEYVLSVYKEGKVPEPEIPEPTVEGKYEIGTYLSGVNTETKIDDFIKNFGVKNGTAKVFDHSGKAKTSGVIATGDKVEVYDNKNTKKLSLNIVIYGDVSGDGKISIVDLANVQKHLLSVRKLGGAMSVGADVNRDGKINIVDLANVQKHLLSVAKITQ